MTLIIDENTREFVSSECLPVNSTYEEDLREVKINVSNQDKHLKSRC